MIKKELKQPVRHKFLTLWEVMGSNHMITIVLTIIGKSCFTYWFLSPFIWRIEKQSTTRGTTTTTYGFSLAISLSLLTSLMFLQHDLTDSRPLLPLNKFLQLQYLTSNDEYHPWQTNKLSDERREMPCIICGSGDLAPPPPQSYRSWPRGYPRNHKCRGPCNLFPPWSWARCSHNISVCVYLAFYPHNIGHIYIHIYMSMYILTWGVGDLNTRY